jgi:acyl transferase domain-containing protein
MGSFLDEIDRFDPAFFGLAPREVVVMDPAHRLLLETAWHALEDAGIVPTTLFNTEVGVFIGGGNSGYDQIVRARTSERNLYLATGSATSTAAGRISYLLGLTGPSVAVDTACSASLTAIHLACQSLRSGESRLALAGGVNLQLDPEMTQMFTQAQMLAADGRCKTFDASADGYGRGEGAGMWC